MNAALLPSVTGAATATSGGGPRRTGQSPPFAPVNFERRWDGNGYRYVRTYRYTISLLDAAAVEGAESLTIELQTLGTEVPPWVSVDGTAFTAGNRSVLRGHDRRRRRGAGGVNGVADPGGGERHGGDEAGGHGCGHAGGGPGVVAGLRRGRGRVLSVSDEALVSWLWYYAPDRTLYRRPSLALDLGGGRGAGRAPRRRPRRDRLRPRPQRRPELERPGAGAGRAGQRPRTAGA